MKRIVAGMLLNVVLFQPIALAEVVAGKVASIDGPNQTMTVQRDDTNQRITVHVQDKESLKNLQAGDAVSTDATRGITDVWEAVTAHRNTQEEPT